MAAPYVASVAAKAGLSGPQWASFAGMAYNIGAIAGYISLGFLADAYGRKPVTLFYFALAFITTPGCFPVDPRPAPAPGRGVRERVFQPWPVLVMPVWLPELFPTRIRATGAAFCFNAPRFIAWIGPLVAGTLIANFGGFSNAAMTVATIYFLGLVSAPFLPETRGKPLPENV